MGMDVKRFNRTVRFFTLTLLLGASVWWLPRIVAEDDYPQYYMGGLIARHGAFADMYPIPQPDSMTNPGDPSTNAMRPEYARLAQEFRVGVANPDRSPGLRYDEARFIQPPPAALLFVPLTFLPYPASCTVWVAVMALFAWGVALLAGLFYRELSGRQTYAEGAIVLLVSVVSPALWRSMRPGNVSPAMGFCLGLGTLALVRRRSSQAAGAMLLGGVLKYATALLVPLALATRRFGAIVGLAVGSVVVIGLSMVIEGLGPMKEFLRLLPKLEKPYYQVEVRNQSVYGFIFTVTGAPPSPGTLEVVKGAQWISLLVLLWVIFRKRQRDWTDSAQALAAGTALIVWFLIFCPVFWRHYITYLLPFFGWLVWEAARGPALRRAAAVGAILVTFVPSGPNAMNHLFMATWALWCALLMAVVAVWRLIEPARPGPRRH